ncbi:hypothetical protein [Cellulosilyticum ruminicola]|uniref:hypothetical protein n=1 Tax=Cellulosilyticum ruminicola TaxID=425254 RepID=UPI0012ED706B|nr:hypothetical protein [Cellulosilyticum ruminicola]
MKVTKVIRWIILAFPVLILLSVVGIFRMNSEDLIPITVLGVIVTLSLIIAEHLNVP